MAKKKIELTPAQALGKAIEQVRESRGITRTQLAESLGVSRGNVWDYEQGKRLTCENQFAIAGALDAQWVELVHLAESMQPKIPT